MSIKIIPTKESDVIPPEDPYHADTGGLSYTVLKLDGEERKAYVMQEYNDNSTNSDEWHGRTAVIRLDYDNCYHIAENIDKYLNGDGQKLLDEIFNAYRSDWNQQSNLIGSWDANLISQLEEELKYLDKNCVELWTAEEWCADAMPEISADTTDKELRVFADDLEPEENGDIACQMIFTIICLKYEMIKSQNVIIR